MRRGEGRTIKYIKGMTTKVRAITYSFDFKSIVRRWVGQKMDIKTDNFQSSISITEIEERKNANLNMNEYDIVVSNDIERALWKSVRCMNMEVEYNIEDLLT